MRHVAGIVVALAAGLAVLVALGSGSGDDGGRTYWLKVDNAFGLVTGADVKVAGVRAGKITKLELDRRDLRARVKLRIDQDGFGDLRADVTCETRPQSLIGEYFVDCKPGTAPQRLPDGATIPVNRTTSTVPPDLINAIMRRPFRERFAVIYNELGGALAARGGDLNETIRRASPALRETNRVLAILRDQRKVIRDLYRDADTVIGALASRREDAVRFVEEARDTAAVSATRTASVRRNLQRLPRFLRELQPTIGLLGETAERQEGALRRLDGNRVLLKGLLDRLGPFADASRPAVRTLGAAARAGKPAADAALPRIAELARPAAALPEVSSNLAITLEHLDDRRFATEKDARSPGGQGYTGLEALLRYVFAQSQSINLVDSNNYVLKIAAFLDAGCAFFVDAARAKTAPARCVAGLGPNRPGINQPDPTKTSAPSSTRRKATGDGTKRAPTTRRPQASTPDTTAPTPPPAGSAPDRDVVPAPIKQLLQGLLPGLTGGASGSQVPGAAPNRLTLLDFLLGS